MEGAQGNSNAPPPFLTKTYEMVDDPMTNSMVSWSEGGRSFIVWNPPEFSRDLLPQYFKHNNFSSFVRQLNTYGFRKIDPYQWEFANEEFIRGQKHLLKSIQRRKPVHSHSLHNQGNSYIALSGSEKKEFEEEIKRLNRDKIQLQLELQRNQSENQGFRYQIKLLSERFQDIDHRQRQLVTFLAQLLQKPESAAILEQQSLLHYKKRRLLDSDQFFSKSDKEEYLSLPGQDGSQVSVRSPALNMEEVERLESSLELLETVLQGADNTQNGARGLGVSSQTSEILVTEVHDFCGEHDTDEEQCSLISPLSSPHHPMDMNSSPDLACSACCVESPPSPCLSINFDVEAKSSETDANSQPSSDPEGEALKEKLSEKADSPSSPPPPAVKENDNFWAQFLTENPSSTDSRSGDGLIDGKPQDHRKAWWNTGNVDDLTKHMKHLSSAENMA